MFDSKTTNARRRAVEAAQAQAAHDRARDALRIAELLLAKAAR